MGKTLEKDKDYTVAYANNHAAGKASLTIAGKQNFTGTRTVEYTLVEGLADGLYTITAQIGGMTRSLDIASGSIQNGGNLQTYDANNTSAQKFFIENVDANYCRIVNARSGKVLDCASGGTSNGTNVQQYSWNASDAQLFKVSTADGKHYAIISKKSGKSLDIAGGSAANGANVQLWEVNGSAAQSWYITAARLPLTEASISRIATQLYTGNEITPAVTVTEYGKSLKEFTDYTVSYTGNKEAGTATATITGKGSYSGTKSTSFEILKAASVLESGKTYVLLPKADTSLAVDVQAGGIINWSRLQLYGRNGTEAQAFTLIRNSDGTYQFLNEKCELSIDVAGGSSANGAAVQLYECNYTAAQKWIFQNNTDGTFTILNSSTKKSLDIPGGGVKQGAGIQMYSSNGSDAQRFYLTETAADRHEWDDVYTFGTTLNAGRSVIDVAGGSKASGANIQIYTYNASKAQQFRVIYSGGGYYRILNVNSGCAMDVQGGNPGDWINIWQYTYNGSDAQLWKLVQNSDGTVTLKNKKGKVLDVAGGSSANGANVQTYTSNGSKAQKWILTKLS